MTTDQDLEALAEEELAQALALDWRQLAALTPWGDTFTGVTSRNLSVEVQRTYLWVKEEGGDILAEVRVYLDEAHFDFGARRSALIRKAG